MIKKNEIWLMVVVLPITVIMFYGIWLIRTNSDNVVSLNSETPVWDLRGCDLSEKCFRLSTDNWEFIPEEYLTPEEFDRRKDIQIGSPKNAAQYYTSRNKILLPSENMYVLSFASVDYANKIYINGELVQSIGKPGISAETSVPMTTRVYYTIKPVDGVIEIVNQVSNFVHIEGGNLGGVYIGTIDPMSMLYARQTQGTSVILGISLLLFIVHVILFMLQRSYRANLYFALFSLVLFIRTGVTGMKILTLVFPQMPWYFTFRMEYLSLPLGCLLLSLVFANMFKGLFHKPVIIATIAINIFEALFIIFSPTLVLTRALLFFQITILLIMIYTITRFFILFSKGRNSEYIVALCALLLMMYASVREILMHLNILIFPVINNGMLDLATLILIIFLMTASFLGTLREIDAARQNEQKLEIENAALARVDRLKTELMTTVSHELRTPLAVIMGYAQLIIREANAEDIGEQTMTDLHSIISETKRLTRIVDEMQTVSLSRTEGRNAPVSINAIVLRVSRMYAPILERYNTVLETLITEEDTLVHGDADELTQVLFNLLSNAGKHTENGVVSILVGRDAHNISVSVEDTGTGIDPEYLPKAFERYSHGDEEGTGLGLSICREIIESCGGRISIESVYGEGTKVKFSLPAFETEAN